MPNRIPLDPVLPARFDVTPNDQRSKAQLDAWWDHPYGVSRPDGSIDVRCLNGGAWDRSTWLGAAPDREAADKLADERQTAWLRHRNRPSVMIDASGKHQLVLLPQRPDEVERVVIEVATLEEAAAYMREHYPEHVPPEEA